MNNKDRIIYQLADTLLLGGHSETAYQVAIARVLGLPEASVLPVAKAIANTFKFDAYPTRAKHYLQEWLHENDGFQLLWLASDKVVRQWPLAQNRYTQPNLYGQNKQRWQTPQIDTIADLAKWCEVSENDLCWLSQSFGTTKTRDTRCQHYHVHIVGESERPRLIEAPKARLAAIQKKILVEILQHVPTHSAACGFVKGTSCLDFAAPHVAQKLVVKMDFSHYFLTIPAGRVGRLFRSLGYSGEVAQLLTGLCCNTIRLPEHKLTLSRLSHNEHGRLLKRLAARSHLPQGAPTSPAIANLCTFKFDARITALAHKLGFVYTRYADDLAFSSDATSGGKPSTLIHWVTKIAHCEGFQINTRKTRKLTQSTCQRLTGLVVNDSISLGRKQLKRLEAELYNCVKLGPKSQNKNLHPDYQSHLRGRLARALYVCPDKARKLAALYDAIVWE